MSGAESVRYLRINDLEFADNIMFNGSSYDILPSLIKPQTEIIKTTERSLSGKMCVDITAVKKNLSVTFDRLASREFNLIREYLSLENPSQIDADGLAVEFFDFAGSHTKETIQAYVDSFVFTPFITDDGIEWQDVALTLIEI